MKLHRQMCGNINKITQMCTAAQENTSKLIKNAISEALTKPQDVIPPYLARDSRTFEANQDSNSSYNTNWMTFWQTNNFDIPQHANNEAYHLQKPCETPVPPHACVGQQPPKRPHLILIRL